MEGVWRCMVEWANLGRGRTELVRKCTDRTDPYGPSRPKSLYLDHLSLFRVGAKIGHRSVLKRRRQKRLLREEDKEEGCVCKGDWRLVCDRLWQSKTGWL
ncbi:hypothetical protein YC2023_045210 [Brassica napus]